MNTLKVLYLTGHSAEANLSAPIIRRMKEDPYFEVDVWDVWSVYSRNWIKERLEPSVVDTKPDIVISPCDRQEMVIPTYVFFANNIPIVRIYGGLKGSGTTDDTYRHVLDCFGAIHLVESEEAKANLIRFGEETWRIFVTGISHLDDVELDYSLCSEVPFAVWLMNPVTISEQQTISDTLAAKSALFWWFTREEIMRAHGQAYVFPPNGDTHTDFIKKQIQDIKACHPEGWVTIFPERVDRNKFLGLLAKCAIFISNSSSTLYEFPALNPYGQVDNPSWRNMERTKPPKLEAGGSDRVISVLKSIDWSDKEKLLRKRFRF